MDKIAAMSAIANVCTRHVGLVQKVTIEEDRIVVDLKKVPVSAPRVVHEESRRITIQKPHKGGIENWCFVEIGGRRCVWGSVEGDPTMSIRTSYVVNHDRATGEIETRNSRYRLIGPEARKW